MWRLLFRLVKKAGWFKRKKRTKKPKYKPQEPEHTYKVVIR